jgi:hypothetical protein
MTMLRNLWNDDSGSGLITIEWLFLAAILAIGVITGLVAVRQALISELVETAQALLALNHSFSFSGQSNCESFTAGSSASESSLVTIFNSSTAASTAFINQTPCD